MLHNEVKCNTYSMETAKAHEVTHNHVLLIIMESARGVQQSSGSQTAAENTSYSYLFSPALRKVLMSSFTSPVEIRAAMKAALFLFLFILLSSFRHDIHYSFHSSEGEPDTVTSASPLFKC